MEIRTLITRGYDLWSSNTTVTSGTCFGSGSLLLESDWQLVSVPVQFGYWDKSTHKHIHDNVTIAKFKNYILDQIEDKYGTGIIEVANTFTGSAQAFFSYVVGNTPESSIHNFNLVYKDNDSLEISGFWIKVVGQNVPYKIIWGA